MLIFYWKIKYMKLKSFLLEKEIKIHDGKIVAVFFASEEL